MKKTLATLAAVITLAACNSSERATPSNADTSATTSTAAPREALLNAYADLGRALSDTSGAAFAATLPYPIPDSVFFAYVDDETYTTRFEQDGRVTTQALFRDYLPQISESVQLREFRELFRHISVTDLRNNDSVQKYSAQTAEPCRQYYLVKIVGNQIELDYGSDHNDAYIAADDAEGEVCEWATIWFFRFDGTKLRLERMFQAG